VVFVLTDDLSWNLVQYMPEVLAMQKQGVTFANYFVTDSLCCPSRTSIFTGRYPHSTGVFTNSGKDGGYLAFLSHGNETMTFASALSAAGYRTGLLGKFLNGYFPIKHPPSKGWTTWAVAGDAYAEFHYRLNIDGQISEYGDKPSDYLTDVVADLGARFVKPWDGRPFFLEIATFAPHSPQTPAPRDEGALPDIAIPHTPAYRAAPDPAAPKWLRGLPVLSEAEVATMEHNYRRRAQSVLAIDALVARVRAALSEAGQTDSTFFVFSSDNGYHMGEHDMKGGKQTAYDADIRVPLVVVGPGVPAGRTYDEIVQNIDLCPTFEEIGGVPVPTSVEGRSLLPLIHGADVPEWRTLTLIEHRHTETDSTDPDSPAQRSGDPPSYEALRSARSLYVEYDDGEKEYHDREADPGEVVNTFAALPPEQQSSLAASLAAVKDCQDGASCWKAQRPAPPPAAH
jgi:arylsulfatase A-like enzyme